MPVPAAMIHSKNGVPERPAAFGTRVEDSGDEDGGTVSPRRIVSLLPSATEIIAALGLRARLIARSHLCDDPSWVLRVPAITGPRLPHQRPPALPSEDHRRTLAEAISVHSIDLDALRLLAPDAVVTRSLAGLYGETDSHTAAALAAFLRRPHCQLVTMAPMTLREVWTSVATVGRALGVARRAEALAAGLAREAGVTGAAACAALAGAPRPRMAVIEWLDPLIVGGNWVPEMIALVGGADPLGRAGGPSRRLSFDELAGAQLDVLVFAPCSQSLSYTCDEVATLQAEPCWRALDVVRAGRVVIVDGDRLLARPGPRLLGGLALLGELAAYAAGGPEPAARGTLWDRPTTL